MCAVVFKEESMGTVAKEEQYVPERIAKQKARVLSSVYELDIERAKYYTDAYKRTEGQLPGIRAARGLEETLGKMTIRIDDEELIVGSKTSKKWGGPVYIEGNTGSLYHGAGHQVLQERDTDREGLAPGICGPRRGIFEQGFPRSRRKNTASSPGRSCPTGTIKPSWRARVPAGGRKEFSLTRRLRQEHGNCKIRSC